MKETVPRVHSSRRSSVSGPLSCLSPDGRTVYSLRVNDDGGMFIDAHNLPLEGYTEAVIEREFPAVIETKFSPLVCSTFQVDTPIELFCAHGDSMPHPPRDTDDPQQCLLPLLCIYTRHSVFLFQLAFQCPFPAGKVVQGSVVSMTEPLESHLAGESSSTSIVRVRPAPQRRMGYATMCPSGSIAMLTRDSVVNEYALVLYHGPHQHRPGRGWISTNVRFGLEQLVEDENTTIVDFCFAQSNGQALLASMSIHLLKESGEVLGASPVLFDGAVVPRSLVRGSVEYLNHVIDNDRDGARKRQCFAARQYFQDAFGPEDDGHHVTAHISGGGAIESGLSWPVQVQGPIVLIPVVEPDEVLNRALVIEPFFARDLVGLAIGRERHSVDFAAVSPTSLLPRFTYMDAADQSDVDDVLVELGSIVERVVVESDEETEKGATSGLISLVRDPVLDSMIHYADSQGVVSISTNSMRVFSRNIREEALGAEQPGFLSPSSTQEKEIVRSTAWSSVDVSAGRGRVALVGAVVSGDAHLGHTLVATLSDGKCAFRTTASYNISLTIILTHPFVLQGLWMPST